MENSSKLPLDVLPLNSLEGTACHIYNATCWAGYHSYKPLSNSFKESSCTFLFSPFKRNRRKMIFLITCQKPVTTEFNYYCSELHYNHFILKTAHGNWLPIVCILKSSTKVTHSVRALKNQTIYPRALSKLFWNSCGLGAITAPWRACSSAWPPSQWRTFS